MKKPASLLTFYTYSMTLALLFLTSCGPGGGATQSSSFSASALMAPERTLTQDERNIATRICYAYQSKSNLYRGGNLQGTRFVFSTKQTDCQNQGSTSTLNTKLVYDFNNNLMYTLAAVDTGKAFNGKVQTDTSGYLSQLCTKIINNEIIYNTVTNGASKVQVSFMRDTLDGYVLNYYSKLPNNTYKIDSAETFKVRSQMDFTTGKILGMDEFYSTQKVCNGLSDKAKFSDFNQTFVTQ